MTLFSKKGCLSPNMSLWYLTSYTTIKCLLSSLYDSAIRSSITGKVSSSEGMLFKISQPWLRLIISAAATNLSQNQSCSCLVFSKMLQEWEQCKCLRCNFKMSTSDGEQTSFPEENPIFVLKARRQCKSQYSEQSCMQMSCEGTMHDVHAWPSIRDQWTDCSPLEQPLLLTSQKSFLQVMS